MSSPLSVTAVLRRVPCYTATAFDGVAWGSLSSWQGGIRLPRGRGRGRGRWRAHAHVQEAGIGGGALPHVPRCAPLSITAENVPHFTVENVT
jgi:hypothetical protein